MKVENNFFLLHAEADVELKRRVKDFLLSDQARSLNIEVSTTRATVANKIYFDPLKQHGGATNSAGSGELTLELTAIKTDEVMTRFAAAVTALGEIFTEGEVLSTSSCTLIFKKIITKRMAPKRPGVSYIFGSVRIQYHVEVGSL